MNNKQDENFKKMLEIGTAGENVLYDYLVANNSYVEDQRHQKYDGHTGPRLKGTEGTLVLPDFVVYNKDPAKGCFAVDAKVKTSVYPVNGKMCFTVDKKFEQYCRATAVKRLDFLMLVFIYKGRMYFYKDTDCIGTTTFDNQYSTGLVYLFEFDERNMRY